jgi:hypothetical protein
MPGAERLPGKAETQLPAWLYIGEEAITLDGANQDALTIPSTASIVELRAETAAVYFSINGAATVNSGGYIPADQGEIIGPLANLNSVGVFASAAAVVHVIYFREA